MKKILLPLLLSCFATVFAVTRDHQITADDYFTQAFITAVEMSPGGDYVAYTEMRWEPPAEKRNTELWIVNTKTSEVRRLTFDTANDETPRWSPDGKWIYFTSARKHEGEDKPPFNGKTQVWKLSVDGGEPFAVTRVNSGIDGYQLSDDGKSLYYSVSDERIEDEWKDLRSKYKNIEYGHGVENYTMIWKLDLVTWRAEKILDDQRHIDQFKVSPDEKHIAMITVPTDKPIQNEGWSRVDIWNSDTKTITVLDDELWRAKAPSPYGWLEGLAWSKDNKKLAFGIGFDGYASELFVSEWMDNTWKSIKLKRPNEAYTEGGTVRWLGKTNELAFTADDHARKRVYGITASGGKQISSRVLTAGDIVIDNFSLNETAAQIAVIRSDTQTPGDIYTLPVGQSDKYKRLTQINPQVDSWKLPQISIVKWQGARGDTVEGILELPADYKHDKPMPMIVEIHGGPTDNAKYQMQFWIYGSILMPSKGYALFKPNYRGSTGFGDKFLADLIGNENNIEVEDILKGVDAMIARGIADSSKLGVMGWSNGGYLTNCIITHDQRFKAASSGAGVIDMSIQWGTEDTPGHVINYMQGLPWRSTEAYRKASPLYNLDKVKTPTLIHVGGSDPRVPPANAKTLYRALHDYVKVPCELLVYPDQGHGVMTYTFRKAKLDWDMMWFDKYILGKEVSEPEKPSNLP